MDSLYYGFFNSNWHIAQNEYLKLRHCKIGHNQAERGIKAIMYTIYTYVFQLWLLPNSHCHHVVSPGNISFAQQTLLQELQELYDAPKDVLATDRPFFHRIRKQQTKITQTFSLHQLVKDTKLMLKKV